MLETFPPRVGVDGEARFREALTMLPHRCNLADVVWALVNAKLKAMTETGSGQAIDYIREWGDERRRLLRDLPVLLRRLQAFAQHPVSLAIRLTPAGQPVQGWWARDSPTTVEEWHSDRSAAIQVPSDVQTRADGLLAAIRTDVVFQHRFPVPPRRPRRGRPAKYWQTQAHARLARCHIPKESRKNLLAAVGLTRPD
jgi:hypothetical protein